MQRKERQKQTKIEINADMSTVPEHVEESHREVMERLLELILLLQKKYDISDIRARFDTLVPDKASVILFNGSHGRHEPLVDAKNFQPIAFFSSLRSLKSVVVEIKKEPHIFNYWSNSVITFPHEKVGEINELLKILIEPDPALINVGIEKSINLR